MKTRHRSRSLSACSGDRDESFLSDKAGIADKEWLSLHGIDELLGDLRAELLDNKPKDVLLFLRNLLVHKVAVALDQRNRTFRRRMSFSEHQHVHPVELNVKAVHQQLHEFSDSTRMASLSGCYAPSSHSNRYHIHRPQRSSPSPCATPPQSPLIVDSQSPASMPPIISLPPPSASSSGDEESRSRSPNTLSGPSIDFVLPMETDDVILHQEPTAPQPQPPQPQEQPPSEEETKEEEEKEEESTPLRHIDMDTPPLVALDIGGSLTKLVFFENNDNSDHPQMQFMKSQMHYGSSGVRDQMLSFDALGGTFHFVHFQTRRMAGAINLMKQNQVLDKNDYILATGGGAYKYSDVFRETLGITLIKGDELACLLFGLNFCLQHIPDECYYLTEPLLREESPTDNFKMQDEIYPYLLVNIGSGVSILKVDSPTSFERVSGTCVGGGTYWGLCRLLTGVEGYEQAMELAKKGDSSKVDMLVRDIYGGDYLQFNLKGTVVASAFGKMVMKEQPLKDVNHSDVARSLANMIAVNIAQLAYLCAMRLNVSRILFSGNFLRNNKIAQGALSYSVHFWSQGVMKAFFLKHEGYFGSLGAFLLPVDSEVTDAESESECGSPTRHPEGC